MHTDPRLLDPTFLLEHDARLRALARRLVHDAALADDIAQDVWLHALRGSHRVETRISGWLSGIARHVAFGRKREHAARSRREFATPPPSPTPSAEDLAAREAARRAVVAAVMRLPDAARDVIVLRFFDDLSAREIGKRIDVPLETVRTRIKRALEQLRRDLDREYGGDGRSWCIALAPILAVPKAALGTLAIAGIAAVAVVLVGLALSPMFETTTVASSSESSTSADANVAPLGPPTTDARTDAEPLQEAAPVVVGPASTKRSAILDAATADVSDIEGRVVDVFGHPIADVRVSLHVKDRRGPEVAVLEFGSVVTTKAGTFTFPAAPRFGSTDDDVFRDDVTFEHTDYPTLETMLASRRGAEVTLRGLVRLRGTVRESMANSVVEGATVRAAKRGVFGLTTDTIATTTSRADGSYELRVPQDTAVILEVTRTNFPPIERETRVGRDPEHVVDIELPPMRPLVLEVATLGSNAAVQGVEVRTSGPGVGTLLGTTSADGRFELAGIPWAEWSATLRLPDRPLEIWFTVPPMLQWAWSDPVRILVPEPWTVRGRLVSADGSPLRDVGIGPARPPALAPLSFDEFTRTTGLSLGLIGGLISREPPHVTLADDGSFEFVDPLAGRANHALYVKRPGEKSARHLLHTFDAPMSGATYDLGSLSIDMTTASVRLRVRDAATTLPGATIVGVHDGETRSWTMGGHGYLEVDDLPAGTWTFTATALPYGSSEPLVVTLDPDIVHPVVIDFAGKDDELATTRGVVLLADGKRANRFNGHVFAMQGEQRIDVRTLDDGSFETTTSKHATEPLRFAFSSTFPICVASANPGATDVVLRHPHLVPFRMRFVDAAGAAWTQPVFFEWKDDAMFRLVPNDSGATPRSDGILEFLWPEGPLTLRVLRHVSPLAEGVIVDVDVRANDDASAPRITVH
ncbi:MAG: sigma-70 family RNA polymerase sigma factor [Planctomycetes bacterium]|nr:sigma-70 family RNA polymerase sigma factor [Planctomycetota bacterium]